MPASPQAPAMFSNRRKLLAISAAFLLLLASALVAIALGAYTLSMPQLYQVAAARLSGIASAPSTDPLADLIVWQIRLPRVLLAAVVGLALATAGTVFQGCFRNPLVEPYILGVSSGAAFGAALALALPWFFLPMQLSAFLGGTLAVSAAYSLAQVRGQVSVLALILSGVIIGALFTALVSILKYLADDAALREIVFWLMGGFYHASWRDVAIAAPFILAAFLLVWRLAWKLNILSMGDEEAQALGVPPQKYKLLFITAATLMTALSVAAAGVIAWVGLMMPHAARMILGPDHRFALPLAGALGATYLIWCDTLARTLSSAEIPVGIIAAIAGAPYLLYLLRTRGKGW